MDFLVTLSRTGTFNFHGWWVVSRKLRLEISLCCFFWQFYNYFVVDPNPDPDPEFRGRLDSGDGVLDLMLKPTLTTYESKEDEKKGDDDDD